MERIVVFCAQHSKIRSRPLIQSASAYLRLVLSKTSSKAVTFTSKLNNPLLRLKRLLMKSLLLAKRSMVFGQNLFLSLALNLPNSLQLQFLSLKRQSMLLLTKLKSKLTSLKTSLSSSNFKNSWLLIFEKKKKSQKQSTTQIKTTWRPPSKE